MGGWKFSGAVGRLALCEAACRGHRGLGSQAGRLSRWGLDCVVAEWGPEEGSWTDWSRVESESGFLALDGIALRILACWLGAISIENRTHEEKCLAPRQSFFHLSTSDVNH